MDHTMNFEDLPVLCAGMFFAAIAIAAVQHGTTHLAHLNGAGAAAGSVDIDEQAVAAQSAQHAGNPDTRADHEQDPTAC